MRKTMHFLIVGMLVFGMVQSLLPLIPNEDINAKAGTPSDDVDGLQYISGDWIVSGPENYTDEFIVLTGNLTIESGGSLILKNVTLAMNCTTKEREYDIEVLNGGSLTITDVDGNPSTKYDFSNITDSPFDSNDTANDDTSDFEYIINVYNGASFTLSNSYVRECENIFTRADNINIQNCTFSYCTYPIDIYEGNNSKIAYNDIFNTSVGITLNNDVNNSHIHNNDIRDSKWGIQIYGGWGSQIVNNSIINDNILHDNGYGIEVWSSIPNAKFYNNEVYNNDNWGVNFAGIDSVVHDNDVYNNAYGMFIRGDNVTTYFNTIYDNEGTGFYLAYLYNSEIYENTIQNNSHFFGGNNLNVEACDMLKIHNNTIQWVGPASSRAVSMHYNSNITFHNNIVTNNNSSGEAIFVQYEEWDTNYRFLNNDISNNEGFGMYIWGYTAQPEERHSIEIINNTILENAWSGIGLISLRHYNITDNVISSSLPGTWGLRIEDVAEGEFSNNTVSGDAFDFVLRDGVGSEFDTYFTVTNCTSDPSKVWMMGEWPTIIFQYFLHVNVTDIWGQAPNIYVEVTDRFGANISSGYTGPDGYQRWIRCVNQTQQGTGGGPAFIEYYDPYNITAYSGPDIAYGEIEPVMDHSQTVNVVFNIDLPPEPPSKLTATSALTDVVLNWEPCHSPDLHHYVIYKLEPGLGWLEAYNQDGTGDEELTFWVDPFAASDWSTYYYRVQAVDDGYQLSEFSKAAYCGDWAVPDTQEYTNFSVQLNGSLIILSGGNLTFNHVDLTINCSEKAQFGVDVKPGGELYIFDFDNNPQTANDRTNISALIPDNSLYFRMDGTKLVMRNSELKDCGSNYLLDYFWWDIDEYSPHVISKGDPATRGLYVRGGDVTIENNNFVDNFVSILVHGASNIKITGNTFSTAEFGVYLSDAAGNEIKGNTFSTHEAYPIYIYNSESNEIFSNHLTYDDNAGIAMYGKSSSLNTIMGNNLSTGSYGVHFRKCGNDNNVTHNNFTNLDSAIRLERTHYTKFSYNDFYNNNGVMGVENSDYTTIHNETTNLSITGYFLEEANNTIMNNVRIENSTNLGFIIWLSRDFVGTNISIKSSMYGLAIVSGENLIFTDVVIEDCFWGIIALPDDDTLIPSRNTQFHNCTVHNGMEEAVLLWSSENFWFVNCSLNATLYNFNLSGSNAISMNTTFNQTRVNINDSSLSIHWLLDVRVMDWLGSPVSNAHVQVRKALGTLVYDGYTDVDGYVRWLWLHERTQYSHSNETSNPHFIFTDMGNHSGSSTIMINISTQALVYLENDPPTVSNVIIGPSYPSTLDDLTLTYMYSDPEDDPEGATTILWYINGTHNPAYNNLMTISSAFTHKDQTWFCEVIPHDGSTYGISMPSMPVIIQNTPPVVTNVVIDETSPRSEDSLHVNYSFSDIDGDTETFSLHRWYVDDGGGWTYSGVDSEELDPLYTEKGDLWKCVVTPGDGDDYGTAVESNVVMIGNTAPEVSNAGISPDSPVTANPEV
jgi:parallel beta-helix repeat protein